MSTIVNIYYQEESSVQVAAYKYIKPCLGMTATVEPTEDYQQVQAMLVKAVQNELKDICTNIKENNE